MAKLQEIHRLYMDANHKLWNDQHKLLRQAKKECQ
jgi:hypothetical protein